MREIYSGAADTPVRSACNKAEIVAKVPKQEDESSISPIVVPAIMKNVFFEASPEFLKRQQGEIQTRL